MPTEDYGVYEQGLTLGTEVSSTYEGRHITAQASELNHGNILAVVTKGYPVIFNTGAGAHGVGVAFKTEVAGTDLIAVDTEGIWNLAVTATDDAAGVGGVVIAGDPLFINTTNAIISKIRDNATSIPFGYALGGILQDATATIAVKVHWDPRAHWLQDEEKLYFGRGLDVEMRWHEHLDDVDMGQGVYMQLIAGWTCPGTGDYFTLNIQSAPTLIAGAGVVGIGCNIDLLGTDGQMGNAITGQLVQPATKAVTGFLASGRFIFKNAADACSTSSALFLLIRNTAAAGYGGVMHSFIRFEDESAADRDTQCLFDLYQMDATIGASNTEIVCLDGNASTSTHVIKISCNGIPYWILMTNTTPV